MTKLLKNALLIALTFGFSAQAEKASVQVKAQVTADAYLDAYRSFNLEKMATFYQDDSAFTDPTSEIWGEHAFNMKGKKLILERLGGFLKSYDDVKLDFRINTNYEAAGHVIYLGKAKLTFTKKGEISTTCGDLTTIITVKNDKVMEHRDYFDYASSRKSHAKGDQQCFDQ